LRAATFFFFFAAGYGVLSTLHCTKCVDDVLRKTCAAFEQDKVSLRRIRFVRTGLVVWVQLRL